MIHYLQGDATAPEQRPVVIAHVVNDVKLWGRGFTAAISRRWPSPERAFRFNPPKLGVVEFVGVEAGVCVANMYAQRGVGTDQRRLDYEALVECLLRVDRFAREHGSVVACPRIGCGLAGGDWDAVERLLCECVTPDVFVYDLPERSADALRRNLSG